MVRTRSLSAGLFNPAIFNLRCIQEAIHFLQRLVDLRQLTADCSYATQCPALALILRVGGALIHDDEIRVSTLTNFHRRYVAKHAVQYPLRGSTSAFRYVIGLRRKCHVAILKVARWEVPFSRPNFAPFKSARCEYYLCATATADGSLKYGVEKSTQLLTQRRDIHPGDKPHPFS